MWILTPIGFFSIVADRDNPLVLIVRARARADLAAFLDLVTFLNPDGRRPPIKRTPSGDYLYRARLLPRRVATVLAEMVTTIDYSNFKSAVGARNRRRETLYHQVWTTLARIENEDPNRRQFATNASSPIFPRLSVRR